MPGRDLAICLSTIAPIGAWNSFLYFCYSVGGKCHVYATQLAAARRSTRPPHRYTPYSLYRRALRCEPLEDRRLLAVVTVNTLSDTVDFNDGVTSLREAIFATNTVPGADVIEFAPSLTASGPATILLTQGEMKITDSLMINGPGAELLTIDASGSDPTPELNNGDGSRVLSIRRVAGSALSVMLVDLSIKGGDSVEPGGGIFNSGGSLKILGGHISGNSTLGGSLGSGGGGIYSASGSDNCREDSDLRELLWLLRWRHIRQQRDCNLRQPNK